MAKKSQALANDTFRELQLTTYPIRFFKKGSDCFSFKERFRNNIAREGASQSEKGA